MPTITFFLRSNNDVARTTVLYCRVTVAGHRPCEFSLREKILPGEWDQKAQTFRSRNKQRTNFINTLLDSHRYKLKSAAIVYNDASPAALVGSLRNLPKPVTVKPLCGIVADYIEAMTGTLSFATITAHENRLKNLRAYEKFRGKCFVANEVGDQGNFTLFDLPEAERFKEWFAKEKRTRNKTSASRNVELFRSAAQWAVKKGVIKNFELSMYEGERDPTKKPVFLTREEAGALINFQPVSKLLSEIKDLFLFQVSTGLSYGNIWQNWIITATPAGNLLEGSRNKNNQGFFVPVDEMALVILEKYGGQLPRVTCAAYNRLVKELAALVGINKHLTTHTARKTFATFMDENGWSRESIAKMLGHKSIKTTETHYLGDTSGRVVSEMTERRTRSVG